MIFFNSLILSLMELGESVARDCIWLKISSRTCSGFNYFILTLLIELNEFKEALGKRSWNDCRGCIGLIIGVPLPLWFSISSLIWLFEGASSFSVVFRLILMIESLLGYNFGYSRGLKESWKKILVPCSKLNLWKSYIFNCLTNEEKRLCLKYLGKMWD